MNSTFHCPLCEVTVFDTREVSEAGRASAENMKPIYSWNTFYGVSQTVFICEYLTEWTVSNTVPHSTSQWTISSSIGMRVPHTLDNVQRNNFM